MQASKKILRVAKRAAKTISLACLVAIIVGVLNGWTFSIGWNGLLVYRGFPYRAVYIQWSAGQRLNEIGQWENSWVWPEFAYVEWE